MGKLLAREGVLILVVGLFGGFGVPVLMGAPAAGGLFLVGVVLGLTFMPIYALALLGGKHMPVAVWKWLGVFAWAFVFLNDFLSVGKVLVLRGTVTAMAAYLFALPGLFGLLLPALAALRAPRGQRADQALWALYLYGLPMAAIRFLLVPAVQVNEALTLLAMQGGGLYMFLHGLLRIYAAIGPESAESSEPLVRRILPDAVVGLAEGLLHRPARPYATTADGGRDADAISFELRPDEVENALARLTRAMQGKPVTVEQGQPVGDKIEVILRRPE
jgi:hypothetical protein